MKIWIAAAPELCPGPTGEIAAYFNVADSTVNVGDDTSGDVLSMQPNGTFDHRPNGTKGEWEVCARDASVNVLLYRSGQYLIDGGIPYKVRYRGRE